MFNRNDYSKEICSFEILLTVPRLKLQYLKYSDKNTRTNTLLSQYDHLPPFVCKTVLTRIMPKFCDL